MPWWIVASNASYSSKTTFFHNFQIFTSVHYPFVNIHYPILVFTVYLSTPLYNHATFIVTTIFDTISSLDKLFLFLVVAKYT